jgi:hypothetical protein
MVGRAIHQHEFYDAALGPLAGVMDWLMAQTKARQPRLYGKGNDDLVCHRGRLF